MKKQPGRKMIGAQVDVEIYRKVKMLAASQERTIGKVLDDALKAYIKENLTLERTKWSEK